jgi:hypothetical protein
MNASIFSASEIQNARGIMDVLAEMLNALDPGNREVPILSMFLFIFKACCMEFRHLPAQYCNLRCSMSF